MDNNLPKMTRTYKNHHLDSTRWESFTPRDGDIVVTTSYKSGTTWTQAIVQQLLFDETDNLPPLMQMFPWIDACFQAPLDVMVSRLDSQEHRRAVKTHLPLDGMPYYSQVKYIVVSRDARDVFMSMWNHYSHYTDDFYERINTAPGLVGEQFPHCPENIREFWKMWMSQGWFEWEDEGYPFWSNLWHTQSWWDYRHLPNALFVHYADLLKDTKGEIKRVADFLGIEITEERLLAIVNAVTLSSMRENADRILPPGVNAFEGGAQTFFNKGTNGRWKEVLTDEDLELYDATAKRVLSDDCAQWLENGRLV